jgi:hypothetical protein
MRSLFILFSHFPARLALYGGLEAVMLQGMIVTITHDGSEIFREDGAIEWAHFGLMVATGAVFLWNWRTNSAYPRVLFFCSTLSFIAALRELDHYSEVMLFRSAYKYPIAAVSILALYYLGKHRKRLRQEIGLFLKQPFFLLLAFGFFLTVIVAQLLGQSVLWRALIESSSGRPAKRVFEEILETIGFLTLFFGALETCSLRKIESSIPSRSNCVYHSN